MPAGHQTDSSTPPPSAADKVAAAELVAARAAYRRMVRVIEADGRYPLEAFRFLQEGLESTVRRVHGQTAFDTPSAAETLGEPPADGGKADPRHVGGGELCLGLRDLAVGRWGQLARLVLNSWNVFATRDFGEMVFVLVDNGFLQKTDDDTVDDFAGVYRLSELEQSYRLSFDRLDADDYAVGTDALPLGGGSA